MPMTSSSALDQATTAALPTANAERITNLDAVRGIAVLGILLMNAVSFGLGTSAYFNLDAGGSSTALDWVIGGLGEVFVDQKFMALFSMLFGAGIVLFADRAAAKGRRAGLLSLWRNALLLVIGLAHAALWDGDVLTVYALCAPLLILLRGRSPRTLVVLGTATIMVSPLAAALAQASVDASGDGLGEYWFDSGEVSDAVGLFLYADFFCRALGMMLIGVALHRTGVITGERSLDFYRRMTKIGLGVGIPLASAGLALVVIEDFSPDVALVGTIPNTIATIPFSLGYLGLITLWNRRGETALHRRIHAVGRMALTNYLTQTIIGLLVLDVAFGSDEPTRTAILGVVAAIWAVQLWWSTAWLERFRYGPAEWAWRCATYRRVAPLRR